ncbi:unnamed protein product, partial [Mesorhabditis spiculigera]
MSVCSGASSFGCLSDLRSLATLNDGEPNRVDLYVPPVLRTGRIDPQGCQITAQYNEATQRMRFKYQLYWDEVGLGSAAARNDKSLLSSSRDVRTAVQDLPAVLCDGPCGKEYAPEHLITIGLCGHYLCNDCSQQKTKGGMMRCMAPSCDQDYKDMCNNTSRGSSRVERRLSLCSAASEEPPRSRDTDGWPNEGTLCGTPKQLQSRPATALYTGHSSDWTRTITPVLSVEMVVVRVLVVKKTGYHTERKQVYEGEYEGSFPLGRALMAVFGNWGEGKVYICHKRFGAPDHHLVELDMAKEANSPLNKFTAMTRRGILNLAVDYSGRMFSTKTF